MKNEMLTIIDEAWGSKPVQAGVIANKMVDRIADTLRFRLIPLSEIAPDLEARYLVKNVVATEALIVVWGRPKCGKSFWTFDLAAHVAAGLEYRGQKVRQGPVIYIAAEGAAGFNGRVEAWRARHLGAMGEEGGDAQAVPFHLLPVRLDLVEDHMAFMDEVRLQTGDVPPALVVIDTLNRTYSGSESSDEDMTRYVAAADRIKAAFQCSVIIVHHCGHETSRPRGHSSLTAAADTQIAIRRDGDFVTATVEWNKDGPEGYVNVSRLDVVEIGKDGDGDPVTTRVVAPCDPVDAQAGEAARLRLSPNLQNALQALKMAVSEQGEATVSAHVPAGALTVSTELWRGYAYKRSLEVDPEGKQDALRQAFHRASKQLLARELIGCWNDRVWIVTP